MIPYNPNFDPHPPANADINSYMDAPTPFNSDIPSSLTASAITSSLTAQTSNNPSTSALNMETLDKYLDSRIKEGTLLSLEAHVAPLISNLVTQAVRSNYEELSEQMNVQISALERQVLDDLEHEGTPMPTSPLDRKRDANDPDDDNDGDDEDSPRRSLPTARGKGGGPGKGRKEPVALGVRYSLNFLINHLYHHHCRLLFESSYNGKV